MSLTLLSLIFVEGADSKKIFRDVNSGILGEQELL